MMWRNVVHAIGAVAVGFGISQVWLSHWQWAATGGFVVLACIHLKQELR